MSLPALKTILEKTNKQMPADIEIKNPFWYRSYENSRRGGLAVYKKYGRIGGDPKYRKEKWREWWEQKGKVILEGCCEW